ncbi:hypothetical protein ISN45_Aa04g010330 [Arabidopsis thaliana x Arabidopsis arenosa]|uniref:Uncharacterized protein n=1 Tax=Arabidopsis thaliana x Arabidopsis arenosa TaxID=1240361 RepID=A0A8T2A6F7_9BRAS|nr:hypothetical protein ISN45_Aa04g010330 [Arabidopsis thaliana x Arabidopsis arenosa]
MIFYLLVDTFVRSSLSVFQLIRLFVRYLHPVIDRSHSSLIKKLLRSPRKSSSYSLLQPWYKQLASTVGLSSKLPFFDEQMHPESTTICDDMTDTSSDRGTDTGIPTAPDAQGLPPLNPVADRVEPDSLLRLLFTPNTGRESDVVHAAPPPAALAVVAAAEVAAAARAAVGAAP